MADYPEILEELAAHLGEALVKRGLSKEVAAQVAWESADWLRQPTAWGGRSIYIPRAEQIELRARDLEIYHRQVFEHWSYPLLAKTYNLTEMRIRQVLARVRQQRRQRVEAGGLFPAEDCG